VIRAAIGILRNAPPNSLKVITSTRCMFPCAFMSSTNDLVEIAEVLQQTRLGIDLVRVRVVTALRNVIHARGQTAANELGDQL